MTLIEAIVTIIVAMIGSGALGAALTAWLVRRKTAAEADKMMAEAERAKAETRKAEAETESTVVQTAEHAVDVMHKTADERCEALEKIVQQLTARIQELERYRAEDKDKIQELEQGRKSDNEEIIRVNQLLGQVMRGAEEQGRQMNVMRSHIDELLGILRKHDIELPSWAEAKP
jgi:wobble nucleotide-excising tRNase